MGWNVRALHVTDLALKALVDHAVLFCFTELSPSETFSINELEELWK
jgi:hypothetical protein